MQRRQNTKVSCSRWKIILVVSVLIDSLFLVDHERTLLYLYSWSISILSYVGKQVTLCRQHSMMTFNVKGARYRRVHNGLYEATMQVPLADGAAWRWKLRTTWRHMGPARCAAGFTVSARVVTSSAACVFVCVRRSDTCVRLIALLGTNAAPSPELLSGHQLRRTMSTLSI